MDGPNDGVFDIRREVVDLDDMARRFQRSAVSKGP
jgi:hypothetical protein